MKRKLLHRLLLSFAVLAAAGVLAFAGVNIYVTASAAQKIVSAEEAAALDADCILILGSSVYGDSLGAMVENRVQTGLSLLEAGASDRLLLSGDHGKENYDEVNAMKQYCVDRGVDPDVVFLDHAGFSTYESMYRAKAIFGVQKLVIVTQRYHLSRAVYIANALGMDAYGVAATDPSTGILPRLRNLVRESAARVKDFAVCIYKPQPTYLGDAIPISGSAALSDDKEYV